MNTSNSQLVQSQNDGKEPWQLQMFRRTLKKKQKLQTLVGLLGDVRNQECLLVTCGDNNGALNWHFKSLGGNWSWVDAEPDSIEQISTLTGDPVVEMGKDAPSLPFSEDQFDVVVTIDVHEHIKDPNTLNLELARIVKTGGRVIVTTPNGDETKPANRIKRAVGMTPEMYGHYVVGYDIPDLEGQLMDVGLKPYHHTSYSRFFTEMIELMINFIYVKVLSKRGKAKVEKGQIAPQSKDQVESVNKSLKLYSLAYPLFLAVSKADAFLHFTRGYAVVVAAHKE
ncbi:MAG: class I SAM-dependent methyltransferase [Anaerolineales bacterium]